VGQTTRELPRSSFVLDDDQLPPAARLRAASPGTDMSAESMFRKQGECHRKYP
jgi:hypothetical protein